MIGVKQSTQNDFVYGELGRIDYQAHRYINIIKYWLKVIYTDEHKYIKCIYIMMLNDMELHPNKHNWASHVKHLLSRLGFLEVWNAQGVGNINNFLNTFKTRVKDIFIQDWHARLEASTRARCYINIANFQHQKYLELIKVEKYRRSLCKLRVSSHRLEVEMGRWAKPNKIPLDNRKCRACGVLEDEFHFILECAIYDDLRKTYIKRYYWQSPNMPKFIELLTSQNRKIIKNLSYFIEKAFKMRALVVLV